MTQPMAPGGQWLSRSADQEPVYVINQDNIRHMLASGWVIVPDPRESVEETEEMMPPDSADLSRGVEAHE